MLERGNRIYLGTLDPEAWGRKTPPKMWAEVALRLTEGEWETVEHERVIDPLGLALTFEVKGHTMAKSSLAWGPLRDEDLDAVVERRTATGTFSALRTLIPWHLNTMEAGCAHMMPAPMGTDGGFFRIGALDNPEPRPQTTRWAPMADGKHAVGLVEGGPERTLSHYTVNSALECPITGYRYGRSWLVRPLTEELVALAGRLGVSVPTRQEATA